MTKSLLKNCASLAAIAAVSLSAAPAFAQDKAASDADTLDTIVVTASAGNRTKLDSSVSVSSVTNAQITNFNPTSDAELMRFLPGIQVPGNGGPGGNANINIRGLQTLSGGSPFLQVQEDGLPVVLTGDMAFANNDYFTHFSPSDERVEAIRGGSASTLASQAVGGVINYISKTSRGEGGFIELEKGLNYDYTKVKGRLSGSLNDTTYFNVGGYFDIGRGTRHASYNVSNSYQIKGNITKELGDNQGYVRFLFKVADTQEPDYNAGLTTASLNGTNLSGFSAVPGFDYRKQSGTFSLFNRQWTIVNYDGTNATTANTQTVQNNGITTRQRLFQLQFHYNVADNIVVDDNGRVGKVSGSFATGFYGASPAASVTSTANGAPIGSFIYANGPNAGKVFTGAFINTNTDIYTRISDLNSIANDLSVTGKFDLGTDVKATLHGGWFYYDQHAGLDWHPNNTFADGTTGNNPAMLDPVSGANGAGALLAVNGQAGFNNNWGTGTCCAQGYNMDYAINAPYANLVLDYDKFSLDASVREEMMRYTGTQYGGAGASTVSTVNVTQIDPRNGATVVTPIPYGFAPVQSYYNFKVNATNWSVGALYKFNENTSVFIRAAHGVRFNTDRVAWTGVNNADGSLTQSGLVAEFYPVNQYEVGVKSRGDLLGGHYTVEATLYKSKYSISSFGVGHNCDTILGVANVTNATTCTLVNTFKDTGYEIFATYTNGGFNFLANLTGDFSKFLSPGATKSLNSPLAHLAYTLQASYDFTPNSTLGMSVTGNTHTFNAGNGLTYPGSAVVTAFGRIGITKNLSVGIDVYNLFNAVAIQGGQPGGAGGNFYNSTIADGRSVKGSVKFSF